MPLDGGGIAGVTGHHFLWKVFRSVLSRILTRSSISVTRWGIPVWDGCLTRLYRFASMILCISLAMSIAFSAMYDPLVRFLLARVPLFDKIVITELQAAGQDLLKPAVSDTIT